MSGKFQGKFKSVVIVSGAFALLVGTYLIASHAKTNNNQCLGYICWVVEQAEQ